LALVIMRIGVRPQFPWVEAGQGMVAVRVLVKWTGRGYRAYVLCGGGRVNLDEAIDALWRYPVLGSVIHGDDYIVELAIPPELAEGWGVVDCVKGVVKDPPREYPVIIK